MNPIHEAVILAGGLGTRLRSVLPDLPKPLAPIGGRPFLRILLDYLKKNGISRVILSTGYKREIFAREFESEVARGEVVLAEETSPLGTGGALVHASAWVAGENFLALNGDTFSPFDLQAFSTFHLKEDSDVTIGAVQRENNGRYGTLLVSGTRVKSFNEKNTAPLVWINAGTYAIRKSIFKSVDSGAFSFEKDFLSTKVGTMKFSAFFSKNNFLDLGLPEDWIAAQKLIPQWNSQGTHVR